MNDEKIIRKKYGERMWHYCRSNFSTILEEPGKLSSIILSAFAESKNIYEFLVESNQLEDFKNYIYKLYNLSKSGYKEEVNYNVENPRDLLDKAGYILYECKTEEEIQSFKKYYAEGEELCTFNGNRLDSCYVYFAVKKDVDNIKREDYKEPKRQDQYGTSVISIQFTKDDTHTLSIKNRYNHTVDNPDATFSNDLDNIIEGLTDSFEVHYGMKQTNKAGSLECFVKATDGKLYKYNYEEDNIYYCENNVIIDNFQVVDKYRDKTRYIIIDYFVIDLIEKTCSLYDDNLSDSFCDTFNGVKNIKITNTDYGKELVLLYDDYDAVIKVNKSNNIIGYENKKIEKIGNNFFQFCHKVEEINLDNVKEIGDNCLEMNFELKKLNFSNVEKIGDNLLKHTETIEEVNLPKVKYLGNGFMALNNSLKKFYAPNVITVGHSFLVWDKILEELYMENVVSIGDYFLNHNQELKVFNAPKLKDVGKHFLENNKMIRPSKTKSLIKNLIANTKKIRDTKFSKPLTKFGIIINDINYDNLENTGGRRIG